MLVNLHKLGLCCQFSVNRTLWVMEPFYLSVFPIALSELIRIFAQKT